METAIRESLATPVSYTCDVLVVGGGFAGIAAAAAAARSGRSVILAERMFMLGGLGTAGLVTIYLPLCDGYGHQVSFGLAEELLRLSILDGNDGKRGVPNWIESDDPARRTEHDPRFEVNFNPHLFAVRAEALLTELGVKILYGTCAAAASVEGDRMTAVIFENKSGRFGIAAKSFVDASGDADLVRFSGAPAVEYGRKNLPAAWYYSTSETDRFRLRMLGLSDETAEDATGAKIPPLSDRRFTGLDGEEISDFMRFAHASVLRDVLAARKTDPTVEPALIASIPQLRMTRRIDGCYTLDEAEAHKRFADSIGMIGDWKKRGPVFEIPFGTLYSEAVRNLICAGRCTSVTDPMWDIMRVIPACSVTGEAAGVAAAMSDDFARLDIMALQQELRRRGVVLHEQ